MNFVYKSLFKKYSKSKLKELQTSSKVAYHLTEFLGQYLDIIEEAFSADQKEQLFVTILLHLMSYLETEIPTQQKYT